jgi:hypothetical protein
VDCDEFKHRLMTDPTDADPEFRAHAGRCADCAREAEQALAFEEQLRRALSAEAGTAPIQRPRGGHGRWMLLGLLPLAAALLWWALHLRPIDGVGQTLGALAIEHVQAEQHLLDTASVEPVSVGAADLLLKNLGLGRSLVFSSAPTLRHVGRCRIGPRDGAHLVMDGERGPVTALVMPSAGLAYPNGASATARRDRFDALILPDGEDAVVLIGEHGEPLGRTASALGLMPPPSRVPLRP